MTKIAALINLLLMWGFASTVTYFLDKRNYKILLYVILGFFMVLIVESLQLLLGGTSYLTILF